MIGTVTEQIRYTAAPIKEIFRKLSSDDDWQALQQCLDGYSDQREKFATFLQEDASLNGLHKEDIELLIKWYDGLGKSDMQGQIIHCNQYREEIRNHLTLAKQDAQVKGKLFTTLGITGSLAFSLMWF